MLKYLIKLFLKHFTVVSVSFCNQKSLIPHLQHLQGMPNMSLFAVHMQLWDELSWAHSHYEKEAADTAAHKFFSSVAVAVAVSADANVAVAALLLWNRLENVFVNTTVIWLDYLGFDCDEHMTWRMQMPSQQRVQEAEERMTEAERERDGERDRERGRGTLADGAADVCMKLATRRSQRMWANLSLAVQQQQQQLKKKKKQRQQKQQQLRWQLRQQSSDSGYWMGRSSDRSSWERWNAWPALREIKANCKIRKDSLRCKKLSWNRTYF